MPGDPAAFIRANTRLLRPPLVPEIRLHLAEESLPIWRKSEEELGELNVPPPFWAFAWAGGQALARYILDNQSVVAGRTVLDLGSGSGIVAIAAAKSGASHVTANDVDEYAIAACRLNAELNGVKVTVDPRDILQPDAAKDENAATVIVLADVFYEYDLAKKVLAYAEAIHHVDVEILVGDPQRSYFPAERFAQIARYPVPATRELEDSEIKNAAVWKFIG